jgi:hypothetical protein
VNILDGQKTIDPADAEALAAAIGAQAASDWRAAAWLLEHSPVHRREWGSREQLEAAVHACLARVAHGISRSGLTPEQQQAVLLSIRAAGADTPLPGSFA